MTKIENNDFTVKKAPAKKMTDAERDLLLKAKEQVEEVSSYGMYSIKEMQEASKLANSVAEEEWKEIKKLHVEEKKELEESITTLQRNADAQKQLISSVNEKNDTLQDKLNIIDVDSVKIVIPNATLENAINEAIMKVNTQLADSVSEVNEVIEKLYADDIQEALKDVGRINDLKNRVCDLEDNEITDLDYEIENAVQNELSNCYYVEESDVERMIDDRLDDVITRDDIDNDLKIYGREINELKARLDNTIYNKVCRLVKSIFSYNLTNKVRSIFKRNKNKAVRKV